MTTTTASRFTAIKRVTALSGAGLLTAVGLAFAVPGHGAVIDGDVKATLTQVAAG